LIFGQVTVSLSVSPKATIRRFDTARQRNWNRYEFISHHISTQSNPKGIPLLRRASSMRKEYDFSRMTGRKNPHVRRLKKQVTIRLGIEAIEPQQRAHSLQLAAGLASEYPNWIISPYGRRFPAACCRVLQYFNRDVGSDGYSRSKPDQFLPDRLCPEPKEIGCELVVSQKTPGQARSFSGSLGEQSRCHISIKDGDGDVRT
jgi:hypothetical protein